MLTLALNPDSPVPLYEQLYEYIKTEIRNGTYPFHSKLPSKRQLAAHLQCSQNTVQNAYYQLISEGYITSRAKSGFFVCKLDGVLKIDAKHAPPPDKSAFKNFYRYDFSHHGVDAESFPFSSWRKITKDVISEYDPDLLKLGNPQGDEKLRLAIADYLHQSRGAKCSPEQIVISSGTEFLMQLLIQLFPEECIYALENPGYEKLNLIFKNNRAKYCTIPLDENGIMVEELQKSKADVVSITPSHQFPTGGIMPVTRRIQLLNWANEKPGRYIIEDDYDSEFKYGGKPIPSLQGLDTGGKVIYIGAFSKSLSPSIRVSYAVLPGSLTKSYREKLTFYICPVPAIEQKTLCRFINDGHFERHLNKMRNIYKKKRETLVTEISQNLPGVGIKGANAGLHLLLEIQNGMSETELIEAAGNLGVKVYGLSEYYTGKPPYEKQTMLLLGYAAMKQDELSEAVRLLRKAWFPD